MSIGITQAIKSCAIILDKVCIGGVSYRIVEYWQRILLSHINHISQFDVSDSIIEMLTSTLNILSEILFQVRI